MLEKQAEDFRKMRSGDMKAFERLFVSLYPGLCNIANHYLNNEMLSRMLLRMLLSNGGINGKISEILQL